MIIALIMAYGMQGKEFQRRHDLNPKYFPVVSTLQHVMGLDKNIPIIVIGSGGVDGVCEIQRFADARGSSVRYIK